MFDLDDLDFIMKVKTVTAHFAHISMSSPYPIQSFHQKFVQNGWRLTDTCRVIISILFIIII